MDHHGPGHGSGPAGSGGIIERRFIRPGRPGPDAQSPDPAPGRPRRAPCRHADRMEPDRRRASRHAPRRHVGRFPEQGAMGMGGNPSPVPRACGPGIGSVRPGLLERYTRHGIRSPVRPVLESARGGFGPCGVRGGRSSRIGCPGSGRVLYGDPQPAGGHDRVDSRLHGGDRLGTVVQ